MRRYTVKKTAEAAGRLGCLALEGLPRGHHLFDAGGESRLRSPLQDSLCLRTVEADAVGLSGPLLRVDRLDGAAGGAAHCVEDLEVRHLDAPGKVERVVVASPANG